MLGNSRFVTLNSQFRPTSTPGSPCCDAATRIFRQEIDFSMFPGERVGTIDKILGSDGKNRELAQPAPVGSNVEIAGEAGVLLDVFKAQLRAPAHQGLDQLLRPGELFGRQLDRGGIGFGWQRHP